MNDPAHDRLPLPADVLQGGIVAVARHVPINQLVATADALTGAGVRVVEVTLDSEDALASIERLQDGDRVVGAGTVMSVAQAADACAAGATFLVSPHTHRAVIQWAVERGVPVMPGAFSPTEVAVGWAAGASAIKLFPANVGGPALLRSLAGPFGDVPFVPSGGVDANSSGDWLAAGAVALGVGGWLTGARDPGVVARRATALVDAVARARSAAVG